MRLHQRLMSHAIPLIDISPLFGGPSRERTLTDQAIMAAAATPGFMVVRGLASDVPAGGAVRADLLRLFQLPAAETRKLWRQKFDPTNPNVYRGWFPLQTGFLTAKEGIDMGADVLHGAAVVRGDDPLREATPLPPANALPGWRESVAAYYRGMEKVSQALMRAIARGLALDQHFFDQAFDRGLSTLRLLRYPLRADAEQTAQSDPSVWVDHNGGRFYVNGAPHVDSGFLTLLAQDGVPGLQARHRDGTWLDVPPIDEGLAVNFGKALERRADQGYRTSRDRHGAGTHVHSILLRSARRCRNPPVTDGWCRIIRTILVRQLPVGNDHPIRRIQGNGILAQTHEPLRGGSIRT